MARKIPEDHDNADRWLVSYGDFMTLLFAFFVVMYAISSVNEGKYRVLSSAMMNAFRSGAPISVSTNPSGGANTLIQAPETKPISRAVKSKSQLSEQAKLGSLSADLRRVLAPLVKGGQVKITQTDKGVEIEIKDSALFPTGQAQPSPQSRAMLWRSVKLRSVRTFTDHT